jgi:hypothetical protein
MSAFLPFAYSRRAEVKSQMPDASNGDLSRELSSAEYRIFKKVLTRFIKGVLMKRRKITFLAVLV